MYAYNIQNSLHIKMIKVTEVIVITKQNYKLDKKNILGLKLGIITFFVEKWSICSHIYSSHRLNGRAYML